MKDQQPSKEANQTQDESQAAALANEEQASNSKAKDKIVSVNNIDDYKFSGSFLNRINNQVDSSNNDNRDFNLS